MPKFRKKPVVIEAMQLTIDNMLEVEDWCRGQIKGMSLPVERRVIDIQTLEGEVRASIGDWVIKGIKSEFYPCKPDIFEATYEPVEPRLMEECSACKGKGFTYHHKLDAEYDVRHECIICNGTGKKPSVTKCKIPNCECGGDALIPKQGECEECGGHGSNMDKTGKITNCVACDGTGERYEYEGQRHPRECPKCNGSGKVGKEGVE